jgi:hypothetical protein
MFLLQNKQANYNLCIYNSTDAFRKGQNMANTPELLHCACVL